MADDDDLGELIGLTYDAALDPSLWPEVVRRTCLAVGATAGHFQVIDWTSPQRPPLNVAWSVEPERLTARHLQSYHDYYVTRDLRLHARHVPRRVYTGGELVDAEALDRSEYLADFMTPLDIYHFCGFALERSEEKQPTFSLHRARRLEDFSAADKALVRALAPHWARAMEIGLRLGRASAESRLLLSLLDASPTGVALLDQEGVAIVVNRAADGMFAAGDVLALDRQGRVHAVDPASRRWLAAATADCLGRHDGRERAAGDIATVRRPGAVRGYAVTVAPVGRLDLPGQGGAPARAILLIRDLDARPPTLPGALRRLYGLTPAEARLAALIADGLALDAAAERLGVTRGTARVTLKRVFAKTDTHRQSELVALVRSDLAGDFGLLSRIG